MRVISRPDILGITHHLVGKRGGGVNPNIKLENFQVNLWGQSILKMGFLRNNYIIRNKTCEISYRIFSFVDTNQLYNQELACFHRWINVT